MYTYNSDSDSLSDASIELAEHIAGKFSPTPPVRTPSERADYKRMMTDVLILPCCCDTCPLKGVCETTGHECQAFKSFAASGKWSDVDLALDLK